MPVRLQKYLADSGVASRRKAEELINGGRIAVNGETVNRPGIVVDENVDVIKFDGRIIKPAVKKTYIMLHKPECCVTTVKDQFGRRTVMDYISDVKSRVVPVGRLDYDTSGLLLLTDDGELLYRLTHPRHEILKTYTVLVEGTPTEAGLRRLRNGIVIDGRKTAEAGVIITEQNRRECRMEITIREGRNRQIRKMCEIIGLRVVSLKRIRIGNLYLGDLKKGGYRLLKKNEIDDLQIMTGLKNARK